MEYSIPSVAKNKHLRQDILDLNIDGKRQGQYLCEESS